jgi:DNA-binding transcriptional LysR family regulator
MSYIDNIRTFVRVYNLGNMSAAARDQRISPAVASSRISQLEDRLGVKLFQRTTRKLHPTEQGMLFYNGAMQVLNAIEDAEAQVQNVTQKPRGKIYIGTPFSIGRRFIAPAVPEFKTAYPMIDIRMRLSDRSIDIAGEGLDMAFFLGLPKDSSLKMKKIGDCPRLLCAAPNYIETRGMPQSPQELVDGTHDCLQLRFPGATEFQWPLQTADGIKSFAVSGPFETDDGDILTNWALDGFGIILKPYFEVIQYLRSGALIPILTNNGPPDLQIGCLYPHRKQQDPKTRLFIDFISQSISTSMKSLMKGSQLPR